jgi:hypothetical protein
MKYIYTIVAFFIVATGFCQETDSTYTEKPELKKEYVNLYYIIPGAFGDNILAKAHDGQSGYGLGVNLYSYQNFYLMATVENTQYKVTDVSIASTATRTTITNLNLGVMYKIPLLKRLTVNPKIAVGYVKLKQKGNGNDYGTHDGTGYTAGFNADYNIVGPLRFFAGVNYTYIVLPTNVNSSYESYFGKLHQVNISIGLKL